MGRLAHATQSLQALPLARHDDDEAPRRRPGLFRGLLCRWGCRNVPLPHAPLGGRGLAHEARRRLGGGGAAGTGRCWEGARQRAPRLPRGGCLTPGAALDGRRPRGAPELCCGSGGGGESAVAPVSPTINCPAPTSSTDASSEREGALALGPRRGSDAVAGAGACSPGPCSRSSALPEDEAGLGGAGSICWSAERDKAPAPPPSGSAARVGLGLGTGGC